MPASIGGHVQEWIDEHGGDHGILGLAAGLMGKIMGGDDDDDDDDDGDTPEARAAKKVTLEKAGVRTGKIQRIVTSILGPKIADFVIPHLQKFEEKMVSNLTTCSHTLYLLLTPSPSIPTRYSIDSFFLDCHHYSTTVWKVNSATRCSISSTSRKRP